MVMAGRCAVLCVPCNSRRGPAQPGSDRYEQWLSEQQGTEGGFRGREGVPRPPGLGPEPDNLWLANGEGVKSDEEKDAAVPDPDEPCHRLLHIAHVGTLAIQGPENCADERDGEAEADHPMRNSLAPLARRVNVVSDKGRCSQPSWVPHCWCPG